MYATDSHLKVKKMPQNRILRKVSISSFIITVFTTFAFVGCSGGGGASSSGSSGTAAQYFNKTAVGNTWTMASSFTSSTTPSGGATTTTTSSGTNTVTVVANSGGIVTMSSVNTLNGVAATAVTNTSQIDSTGALSSTSSTGVTSTPFPANFSVGTTWQITPSQTINTTTYSAQNAIINAFNVTRTVPAGTFTDCLELTVTGTSQEDIPNQSNHSVTTATYYYSPTVGILVDGVYTNSTSSLLYGVSYTRSAAGTLQLQAGYVANP